MSDWTMPEDQPAKLTPWLARAAISIEITHEGEYSPVAGPAGPWRVAVANGMGGHDGASATVAHCLDEMHAELVAAALWALVREQREKDERIPNLMREQSKRWQERHG